MVDGFGFDFEAEFSHLRGVTYLDHAGATLYAQSQLQACFQDMSTHVYGNPHSNNPSSLLSTETIEQTRQMILEHFNTDSDHYQVVFTSGCTQSLKLVGETFPWNGKRFHTNSQPNNTNTEAIYIDKEHSSNMHHNISNQSLFCYLEDNHNSVVGIREIADQYGAQPVCVTEDAIANCTYDKCIIETSDTAPLYHLFAYPAQSNFSGYKYPLKWTIGLPKNDMCIKGISSTGSHWLVLLDASSYIATNHLDLESYPAHYVTISFYKLFGYPTGLGALLIRQDIADLLEKPYFGGGTVLSSITRMMFHQSRPLLHERFEDGTVSFLDIAALRHGFQTLQRFELTMEHISLHTYQLANLVYNQMKSLKHNNGHPLCILYTKGNFTDRNTQGGIIAFNLLRSNGSHIGYSEVDKMSTVYNIHLRTGCFCNSGACQVALGLTSDQLLSNMKAGHVCGDSMDIIDGQPTGCVRISFGYMSTLKDAETFIDFITNCFLESRSKPVSTTNVSSNSEILTNGDINVSVTTTTTSECSTASENSLILERGGSVVVISGSGEQSFYILNRIIVYPVKSCSGYEVAKWALSDKGLLWDRVWMIVNERGACLSQKQEPKLCLIHPEVDVRTGDLTLKHTNAPDINIKYYDVKTEGLQCRTKVCGDRVQGIDCGDGVASWLYNVLGRHCRLLQMDSGLQRKMNWQNAPLSFSNEAQYLLLTESSLQHLHSLLLSKHELKDKALSLNNLTMRFRANLVVCQDFEKHDRKDLPFVEDDWQTVIINKLTFQVLGGCSRCQMICVDQQTGIRTTEPLQTLLSLRGSKATFGIYLALINYKEIKIEMKYNTCPKNQHTL